MPESSSTLDIFNRMQEFLPLVGLYAELHYRLPIPFSRYFRKEPEIIFDCAWRVTPGRPLKVFLLIKDAHLYPIQLDEVTMEITRQGQLEKKRFHWKLDEAVDQHWFYQAFDLDVDFAAGYEVSVSPELNCRINGVPQRVNVDNYKMLASPPLRCWVAGDPLPTPAGWYRGDMHLHTALTSDQIEFGAPLPMTRLAAENLGMDFLGLTDHSYDLDDYPDDYRKNDPELTKWRESRIEIEELNRTPGPLLLSGEEISSRNHKQRTVHLLHYQDPRFYPGTGDGAEKWLPHRSEFSVDSVLAERSESSFSVAAHSSYEIPLVHRILFGRDHWHDQDLAVDDLDGIQIISGTPSDPSYIRSRQQWIRSLLAGHRLAVIGGSDAHGNFNRFRQIRTPMFSMVQHEDQILGQAQTLLKLDALNIENITTAVREARTAISTGPAGELMVSSETFHAKGAGDCIKIPAGSRVNVRVKGISSKEFGMLTKAVLYQGMIGHAEEKVVWIAEPRDFQVDESLEIEIASECYLRMELSSPGGRWPGIFVSSPIWMECL